MRRVAGFLAVVMALTVLSVPAFAAETVTDPGKVAMSENFIVFEEDFSDNTNGWTLTGPAEIRDGKLYLSDSSATAEEGTGIAKLNLSQYDTDGDWYITFKARATDTGGADNDSLLFGIFGPGANQTGRAYWRIRRYGDASISDLQAPASANEGLAAARCFSGANFGDWVIGKEYEYMFAFREKDGYDVYDLWRRPLSNGEPAGAWHKMNDWREAYWHTGNAAETFQFQGGGTTNLGAEVVLDDLRIYQGSYAALEMPAVTAGNAAAKGTFMHGYSGIGTDRRLTHLTAVYDKENGYTKKVVSASHTAVGGEYVSLNHTVAGVNAETDTVATMLWDSLETGIPLITAKDTGSRNTADETMSGETEASLAVTANFNEVTVKGYAGMGTHITASLAEKSTGNVAAVLQTPANSVGKVEAKLAVDPAQWASGAYIVRVQYGNTAAASSETQLYTNDILGGGVTSADAMEAFLLNYAAEDVKALAAEDGFAEAVYEQYVKLAGDAAGATDLYAFRKSLDPAVKTARDEHELLKEINGELNAEIISWGKVRTLITETYAKALGLTEADLAEINSITDQKNLFLALEGGYATLAELRTDLDEAVDAQLAIQNAGGIVVGGGTVGGTVGGGTVGGGVGGGAGGGNYLSGNTIGAGAGAVTSEPPKPVEGLAAFTDLGSVPWAQESINGLQSNGIIHGDGSGAFHPDRAVTREEFLKMEMQAAKISLGNGGVSFEDVDENAWYYSYIAAAYEKGIVKGISETSFGIGQEITRADMAVMLMRMLEHIGVEVTPVNNAFVFDDFDTIPKYARESITTLCQGGLMQGVGSNRFDAPASATRAEAAVAIYRIYNYIGKRR